MDRGKAAKKAEEKRPARAERGQLYKIGDVCAMTDTQPYVLRFWESEFPQLAPRKSRSGQRMYGKKDVDLVNRIKTLLYEEEYTIAGARKKLEEEGCTAPEAASATPPRRKAARSSRQEAPGLRKLRKELEEVKRILES